jgi:hypothetical protein
MCCGRFNQQIIKNPGSGSEVAPRAPDAQRLTMSQMSHPRFEYVGKTALTVVSPLTRRQYRFARPGARLDADIKDRSWLTFVPNLRRVG